MAHQIDRFGTVFAITLHKRRAAHIGGTGREVRPGACHEAQRRCCDKLDLRWPDPRVLGLQSAPR
jgi:hypothetical protein